MVNLQTNRMLGVKRKTESGFQVKFLTWLKQFNGYIIEHKYNSGAYAKKFLPDVQYILNGHVFFFELKVGKNTLSKGQRETKATLEKAGAFCYEVNEAWFFDKGKHEIEAMFLIVTGGILERRETHANKK